MAGLRENAVRILLVEDDEKIASFIIKGMKAAGCAVDHVADGREGLTLATTEPYDAAIVDIMLPGLDGIEVAAELASSLPACGVVIVTSHGRPGYLKRALETGVRAFLPKTTSARVLADVVRQVHGGGRYVDPELAADAIATGSSPLTAREADVLELAAEGAPVEEIAKRAALAPGTVRNYLSSAAAKLGVSNRHEAARLARSNGWI